MHWEHATTIYEQMDQLSRTLASHWKYVSEGGATIVFSYVGPPNPSYDGMVLRLRKATSDRPSAVTVDDEDDPIIEFRTKCIERLLPRENLPRLRSVHLERDWLERLGELHENQRPEARKDHIDLSRKKAVLATDLVGGDWIAVEIKVGLCGSVVLSLKSRSSSQNGDFYRLRFIYRRRQR